MYVIRYECVRVVFRTRRMYEQMEQKKKANNYTTTKVKKCEQNYSERIQDRGFV